MKAPGFTEEQAEVIVDASRDALSQLVTHDDLRELEQRMTIKVGALLAAAVGLLIAVLRVSH